MTRTPRATAAHRRPGARRRALLAGLLLGLPLAFGAPERGDAGEHTPGPRPPAATEGATGAWRYVERTDGFGIRRRIAYTRARGSDLGRDLVPAFVLSGHDGKGEVFLYLRHADPETPPPAPLCQSHGAPPVMIKFGNDEPFATTCATEVSGNRRVLFLGPVLPIWYDSAIHETLTIGVVVAQHGVVFFTFPVGRVDWKRILDPDQVRYLDRMTERSLRGEDTRDMWDMTTSQDLRKGIAAERPKQRSQAPRRPAGATKRDLRS